MGMMKITNAKDWRKFGFIVYTGPYSTPGQIGHYQWAKPDIVVNSPSFSIPHPAFAEGSDL